MILFLFPVLLKEKKPTSSLLTGFSRVVQALENAWEEVLHPLEVTTKDIKTLQVRFFDTFPFHLLDEKMNDDDVDEVGTAFRQVCDILLRAQIASFEAGREVNNRVTLSSLSPSRKQSLRAALGTIENLAARARSEFTGTTL